MAMEVKFGFYLDALRGLGIYNPEKEFYEAKVLQWLEVREGQFIAGNPIGKQVTRGDAIALLETLKTTAEWVLEGLLPGSSGGTIVSLNYAAGEKWFFYKPIGELPYEKTPYGWLLRPELGTLEVDDAEIALLPPVPNLEKALADTKASEVPSSTEQPKRQTEARIDVQPPKRISIPALGLAAEQGITPGQLAGAYPNRTWIGTTQVTTLAERRRLIVPASPAGRALARRFGLELFSASATGPQDSVTREDVMGVLAPKGVVLLPITTERRTLAHNLEGGISNTVVAGGAMRYSLHQLQALRARVIVCRADRGEEVFYNVFGTPFHISLPVACALARVLAKDIAALLDPSESFQGHALFNGYWHIDNAEKDLRPHERRNEKVAVRTYVHLGISYDVGQWPKLLSDGTLGGQGLRVLTFRDAHMYVDIHDFFPRLGNLTQRAEEDATRGDGVLRATRGHEWSGASIILNNIGAIGHEEGLSLLPPAISSMFNMGRLDDAGNATLQIFFDHRMIDGRTASRFLNAVYEELVDHVIPEIIHVCFP